VNAEHFDRNALTRALQAGPDCLPLDRLADRLSAADQAHLDGCPRCQAEEALLRAVDAPESPDERNNVRWIASRLSRSRPGATRPAAVVRAPWLSVSRLLPLAATLAFAAALGYAVWDPEPGVRQGDNAQQVYRTTRVEGMKPSGDIDAAPGTFSWVAFPDAALYDVEVSEVDGTSLWRGSTTTARIDLPPWLQSRCIPGKTILWQVTAKSASGAALAGSGPQKFRVSLPKR
jgi:hypothetical protein